MRTLFGVGAIGETIKQIQSKLTQAGFDTKGTDGHYGQDTASAVRGFQTSKGSSTTGTLDDSSWQSLMQRPVPGCPDRCLQLTANFEGHGFELAVGNFDGALLTWGIIGFTLKASEVSDIILAVNAAFPDRVQQAFGASASELLTVMQASTDDQETWADTHTLPNGLLAQPWRDMFAVFGSFPEVQQEQIAHVQTDYMSPAIKTAKKLGLKSELGLALCFDIHVQNGGIKKAAMEQIQQELQNNPSELDLRKAIANAVADNASKKFQEDVRTRKLTVATGQGTVHGHSYLLENWGLSDQFDADELRQPAAA
jgi:hypothetical protein